MIDVGELFERHHGIVYRRCLALLGQPDDAAEAVQDVFEAALSGLGRFRIQSSPLTWLYAIATRHCLQLLRNRYSRQFALALLPPPPESVAEVAPTRLDLELLLRALTREEQELTVYAFRDGMTQQEISEVTGLSRRTVSRRLEALQGRLAAALGNESRSEAPAAVSA
jgi:RNA polymerase sigma-70 factor, ECF subfamily